MDIDAVRQGLKANLDSIPDVQVSAYAMTSPTPPYIQVIPGTRERESMNKGLARRQFRVQMYVGTASDVGAQKRLDRHLQDVGNESVLAALEADKTLGGAATTLDVVRDDGHTMFRRENLPPLLGAEWTVDVYARGD